MSLFKDLIFPSLVSVTGKMLFHKLSQQRLFLSSPEVARPNCGSS
jgi:hypothetical protein